jgi:hypothetical protein
MRKGPAFRSGAPLTALGIDKAVFRKIRDKKRRGEQDIPDRPANRSRERFGTPGIFPKPGPSPASARAISRAAGGYEPEKAVTLPAGPKLSHPKILRPYLKKELLGCFMVRAPLTKPSFLSHLAALLGIFFADQGVFFRIQAESLEVFLGQQFVSLADMGL